MKKHMIVILALVMLMSGGVKAQQTIEWTITVEPPITYVDNGEYIGYGMEILSMIQESMPAYQHNIVVAGNYMRLASEVETGPCTCALGFFKTDERLEKMFFSTVPVFYFFDIQIVLRKNLFDQMGRPGSVSLKEMLEQTRYRLGVSHGRTYSPEIREILSAFKGKGNIFTGAQGNVAESLLKMLVSGRIDYMFLYPEEAIYLSKNLGIDHVIASVPIEEANEFSYSWAACTRSAAGKAAITDLSEVLERIRREARYRELYEVWISENLLSRYRENYSDHFLMIREE